MVASEQRTLGALANASGIPNMQINCVIDAWHHLACCRGAHHPGTRSEAMPKKDDLPTGFHSVTPRIFVTDVDAQVEFLRVVFDATGEVPTGRPAEIRIGDSLLMVSSAGERELFPAFLYVYVDEADSRYQRALNAGAVSVEEPADTPYGDRRAMVRDPFGNVFQIAHRSASAR